MIPRSERITRIISSAPSVPKTIAEIVKTLDHLKSFWKFALIAKITIHVPNPKLQALKKLKNHR